jgi:hypothetical protein
MVHLHPGLLTGFHYSFVGNHRYLSCEQAYQAAKFTKASPSRVLIDQAQPLQGESDKDFGERCWSLGHEQSEISRDAIDNWDSIKVQVMLSVNRAKYTTPNSQNRIFACTPIDLMCSTGTRSTSRCRSSCCPRCRPNSTAILSQRHGRTAARNTIGAARTVAAVESLPLFVLSKRLRCVAPSLLL